MTDESTGAKTAFQCGKLRIPRVGVWLAVVGSFLFAMCEACTKFLTFDVTKEILLCSRYFMHGVFTIPLLFTSTSSIPGVTVSEWFYGLIGGLMVALVSYVANYGYDYIPLLDAFVLENSQPIFTAVIAWLWLQEKLTIYDLGTIILTLAGVVVACQPSFIFGNVDTIDSESRLIGSAYALGCGLCMALATCFTRKLKDAPLYWTVYLQGLVGVALGFIAGMAMGTLHIKAGITNVQITALVFVGILGFVARWMFTIATQTEDATLIAVLETLEIPFSFFAELVMLDAKLNYLSIIGALIVMIGTALLAAKQQVKEKASYLKESFKSRFRPTVIKKNNDEEKQLKSPHVDYGTTS